MGRNLEFGLVQVREVVVIHGSLLFFLGVAIMVRQDALHVVGALILKLHGLGLVRARKRISFPYNHKGQPNGSLE